MLKSGSERCKKNRPHFATAGDRAGRLESPMDRIARDGYSYLREQLSENLIMSVNQSDLESFHQFAVQVLAHHGEDLSLEDLLKRWRAQQDRTATIASVRRGVDDANAGRVRDAAEVDAAIRAELHFPARRQ